MIFALSLFETIIDKSNKLVLIFIYICIICVMIAYLISFWFYCIATL